VSNLISLHNASKFYRTNTIETVALDAIHLEIEHGEFVAIVGPSGSGKSTLLNVLGLLEPLNEGTYRLDGQSLAEMSLKDREHKRLVTFSYVFQNFALIDNMSILDNVCLGMRYRNEARTLTRTRALELLTLLGIEHRAAHFPPQLSGGQQQRCAIARALISHPKAILADEPTGNLDHESGQQVMALLESQHAAGVTLIVVTHSEDIAARAQRVIRVLDGRIEDNIRG